MNSDDPTRTGVDRVAVPVAPPVPGVVVVFSHAPVRNAVLAVTSRCVLGRSAAADLEIDESELSRSHAELEPAEGGVLITDLGSHNGTFVNGTRIEQSHHLAPVGSVVRAGRTLFCVVSDVRPFQDAPPPSDFPMLGGPWLVDLRSRIERVAKSDSTVIVQGETGTGKNLVAAELHRASGRTGPLLVVHGSELRPDRAPVELFGHEEGAFPGAEHARAGLFRAAHGGTLVFDQVDELHPEVQVMLLHTVEDGKVLPIGESEPVQVDVKVVATTRYDLHDLVRQRRFDERLYFRLAGERITLPPVRDRREDIPALARHFLADPALRFTTSAMEHLLTGSWPDNVWGIHRVVARAAVRAQEARRDQILREDVAEQAAVPWQS